MLVIIKIWSVDNKLLMSLHEETLQLSDLTESVWHGFSGTNAVWSSDQRVAVYHM